MREDYGANYDGDDETNGSCGENLGEAEVAGSMYSGGEVAAAVGKHSY